MFLLVPAHRIAPPPNCCFPWRCGPHLTHDFLSLHEFPPQMAGRTVQPFLQNSPVYPTDTQTHRLTDRQRYIYSNRPHIMLGNAIASVRLYSRTLCLLNRLTSDLDILHVSSSWPWLAENLRSRSWWIKLIWSVWPRSGAVRFSALLMTLNSTSWLNAALILPVCRTCWSEYAIGLMSTSCNPCLYESVLTLYWVISGWVMYTV